MLTLLGRVYVSDWAHFSEKQVAIGIGLGVREISEFVMGEFSPKYHDVKYACTY
jgi:hypothetical protein